jgi:hypothetical protein
MHIHQLWSARQYRGLQLGFHRLELDVQAVNVSEFLGGHPAAGSARQIPRPHCDAPISLCAEQAWARHRKFNQYESCQFGG